MLLRAPRLGTCNHCAPCIKTGGEREKYHMTKSQCILSFIPSLLSLRPPLFSPTSWDRFTWDRSYGGVMLAGLPRSSRLPLPLLTACTAARQENSSLQPQTDTFGFLAFLMLSCFMLSFLRDSPLTLALSTPRPLCQHHQTSQVEESEKCCPDGRSLILYVRVGLSLHFFIVKGEEGM